MKKVLIISSIILAAAIIVFGISVVVTGVKEEGFGISISGTAFMGKNTVKSKETYEYNFDEDVDVIDIAVASANMDIRTGDVSEIAVKYTSNVGGYAFDSYVSGDTLYIREEAGFLFHIFSFGYKDRGSRLEVILPEKEYDSVNIAAASGGGQADGIICKSFSSDTASGELNYNIFAENIYVNTASGGSTVTNCTDRKANIIKLVSLSGDHTISGFNADSFELDSTSGTIRAKDITGKVKANVVSGDIFIDYTEWTEDLELDAVSGSFDITLPEGSGVEVELSAISGGVSVGLEGEERRISGSSETGRIGGENIHKVEINLVSGDVRIHN